jgi:hypothetical protein
VEAAVMVEAVEGRAVGWAETEAWVGGWEATGE